MGIENLAINGGKKVFEGAFPSWPQFNPAVYDKVVDILKSGKVNYWTGKVGMEFEKKWAEWLGVKNAISVANGTCALHTALASLGVGPGDASLGRMLSEGQGILFSAPWCTAFPALVVVVMILGVGMLGEGLRENLRVSNGEIDF